MVGFLFIAQSLQVGDVTLLDVAVAAPLAMVANILPFTPGGLGIGEAAFEQICRWLAPAATLGTLRQHILRLQSGVDGHAYSRSDCVRYAPTRHQAEREDNRYLTNELVRRGTHIE